MIYYHKFRKILKNHDIKFDDYEVFIETGLYMGETLSDLYLNGYFQNFSKIYSIEIEKKLIENCFNQFSFLNEEKFEIVHGDSSIELENIIQKNINKKTVFWLDGHYSGPGTGKSENYGECPVIQEIKLISKLSVKPLIIIDDVSLFMDETWKTWKSQNNEVLNNHKRNDWPLLDQIKFEIKSLPFEFDIIINDELSYLIAL